MALKMQASTILPHCPVDPTPFYLGVFLVIMEGKCHHDPLHWGPRSGGPEHHPLNDSRQYPYLCFWAELRCRGLQSISRAGSMAEIHRFLEEERWC